MKPGRLAAYAGALLLFGPLCGCTNPNKVDASNEQVNRAERKADNAADQAGSTIKDAAKDVTAAVVVTPLVKNAITADDKLNDTRNTIDVDSKDNVVHLRGSVLNNDMKARAGQIAQKVLNEHHSTDRLSNELTVKKH
jgi:osmotically-inducible protein OsmY